MFRQWLLSAVLIIVLSPWSVGYSYSVLIGQSFKISAVAGLTMIAYAAIVTFPLALVSGMVAMVVRDVDHPYLVGLSLGASAGLLLSALAICIFQENWDVWLLVFTMIGSFVGFLEAWLWKD